MCLIIQREPKFVLPFEKFKAAILNNPDGYGLSFPDDKGLSVFRTAETPDPEKLYRLINEELIDKKIMIHLRYTTAGSTSLRNSHPFPVLEKKTDGVDLRMAHNGTLHKYKFSAKGDESDTRCFVREFVRPLFKRLIKGLDSIDILNDDFVKELLEDRLSTMSVLTFLDSEGNSLICNGESNGGKQEEGWYYSNTYSFNESHRLPKTTTGTGKTGTGTSVIGSSFPPVPDTNTTLFTTKFKIKHTRDLIHLTDDTIESIVRAVDPAILLIKELLMEKLKLQEKIEEQDYDYQLLKEKCKGETE